MARLFSAMPAIEEEGAWAEARLASTPATQSLFRHIYSRLFSVLPSPRLPSRKRGTWAEARLASTSSARDAKSETRIGWSHGRDGRGARFTRTWGLVSDGQAPEFCFRSF